MNGKHQHPGGPAAARTEAPRPIILLAEDSAMVRRVYGRVLVAAGYRVLLPLDVADARRVAQQMPEVDLVLTNCDMPGASPQEVAQWFERSSLRPPVLLITHWPEGRDPPPAPLRWTVRCTPTANADELPVIVATALKHG